MFTKMSDGTKEEWEHISQEHAPHIMDMPTRVIEMLKQLEGLSLGLEQINYIMPCKQQLWRRELELRMKWF